MNKQTTALIALYAGWMLTADTAHAITYEDIAGQWCGDVTDYVFAPNTLTVKFHDGNAQRCPLSAASHRPWFVEETRLFIISGPKVANSWRGPR
jgi:hypothetical protein